MNKKKIISAVIAVICVSAMCLGIVSSVNADDTIPDSTSSPSVVESCVATETTVHETEISTAAIEAPVSSPMDFAEYYSKEENLNLKETKDYIYYKMLNSIDYYDKVSGSIKIAYGDVDNPMNVKFESDLVAGKAYTNITYDKIDDSIDEYCENGEFTEFHNIEKIYSKYLYLVNKKTSAPIENSQRVTIEFDGNKGYHYRADSTNVSCADTCLFPQGVTFGFLENQDLWSIKGTEKLFDRDCVVINGVSSKNYGNKLGVNNFVFYVDLNTGVVLKYEGYTSDGIISDFMYVNDISFSNNITVRSFTDSADKYTDYTLQERGSCK